MELLEFLDFLDSYSLRRPTDPFLDRMRPHRRKYRVSRENPYADYEDEEFRTRFRLTKSAANYLLTLIEKKIKTTTTLNAAISPDNRLLITLYYYANGTLQDVCDWSGISKATVSRIIVKVTETIGKLKKFFVKIPQDLQPIADGFYQIAKLPKVMGAIDCLHVQVKSPGGDDAKFYKDSLGNYSINVQTLVDHDLKIMDIEATWPGSYDNQTVFDNSNLKQRFINSHFSDHYILGDREYTNSDYLVTPLHNSVNLADNLYNESLMKTHNVVERTYSVWKSRFPVLTKKNTLDMSKVPAIVVACAVLHNIAILSGDEHFEANLDYFERKRTGSFTREDEELQTV